MAKLGIIFVQLLLPFLVFCYSLLDSWKFLSKGPSNILMPMGEFQDLQQRIFLLKFANFRSIMSHYNPSSDGRSSFRFNSSSGYFQSPYTTVSNGNCSSGHTHHHYPPQYNQCQTPAVHYPHHVAAVNSNGGGHTGGHGRLQKSLSFAFQTPQMMNDMINAQYTYQNHNNQNVPIGIRPPERSYSR